MALFSWPSVVEWQSRAILDSRYRALICDSIWLQIVRVASTASTACLVTMRATYTYYIPLLTPTYYAGIN